MATLIEFREEDVMVIRLQGGLTFEGVGPVAKPFESATRGGAVIVDLSEVPFVSTPGLSLLLSGLKRIQYHGGRMVLTGLTRHVGDLLRRCRLDRVFVVTPDQAGALDLLRDGERARTA